MMCLRIFKDSGYDIVPKCKRALKECSIFAVLAVSSLVMKSTAEALFCQTRFFRCFGDHSAEPFVSTIDESNIGDEIKEIVSMNLYRTKHFRLKNLWPPDLFTYRLYLVFWG